MKKFQELLNRFNNKDRDLITTLYEGSGDMFRRSIPGKLVKGVVTSDVVKKGRNKLLDMSGAPEHYKQFAKYLTGGTIGNKDITELPANIRSDVIAAHLQKPTKSNKFVFWCIKFHILMNFRIGFLFFMFLNNIYKLNWEDFFDNF